MAQPRLRFTRADHDRLPEDFRVELIDGVGLRDVARSRVLSGFAVPLQDLFR